jgi:NTE family protein
MTTDIQRGIWMKIGLALSGGGMRAAAFHCGVLRRLAEQDLLENVAQLSTVSGGSLMVAALLGFAENKWPTSGEFRDRIYSSARTLFTTTDLLSLRAIGLSGAVRFNARLLTHRATVLADMLERRWRVSGMLADLPEQPIWWINATSVETGKCWRFSKREMGDWVFGRHYSPQVRIAEAVAASAAVPYVIGALHLQVPEDGWYRTDPATRAPVEKIRPKHRIVRLWDGGAYENLGLETLFKPGEGLWGCDFLICSDASGPIGDGSHSLLGLAATGRLPSPRLFDICSDQIRSLRSRMLVKAIHDREVKAVLIKMGNSIRDIDIKIGRRRDQDDYDRFLADQDVAKAHAYPTDLKALPSTSFDSLARHGYELADASLTTYVPDTFSLSLPWKQIG